LSGLIVVLERPGPRQKYFLSFEQFVFDCHPLKAVDDLIRFATKGARSIYTVTVVDAYTFKPDKSQARPSDEECHLLLEKILKTKKPKAVLCCWQAGGDARCNNKYVEQFMSRGVGCQPIRADGPIENHATVIIRSFHPATAVKYNTCNMDYPFLLIYHFIAAFAELSGLTQDPQWLVEISLRAQQSIR
jgi:hypothetical protein